MPLFSKKIFKAFQTDSENGKNARGNSSKQRSKDLRQLLENPQLIFHCQLAHGSPTGLISGFQSARELYQKIADCYDIPVEDILFCTLNTHKVDMCSLLGGQIGLDDFIFAHQRGRAKEIEVVKSSDALGLTITDNGVGFCFIKRIKENSIIHKIPHICIGDHIERLNDVSMVGKRHFEVARILKEVPTGSSFSIRLIEPMQTGFECLKAYASKSNPSCSNGKETLRFNSDGASIEEKKGEHIQSGIDAINSQLESFLGISDNDLALKIWDLASDSSNSLEFSEAIENSDLNDFEFTDEFVMDLWGAVSDARRKAKLNNRK